MTRLAILILLAAYGAVAATYSTTTDPNEMPHNEVRNWALKMGFDMWAYGDQITNIEVIRARYHTAGRTSLKKKDGMLLTREIAAELRNLIELNRKALIRVMEAAEYGATEISQRKELPKVYVPECQNLREIEDPTIPPIDRNEIILQENRHFENFRVNTSSSCILYPSSVSVKSPAIQNDLRWLQSLDAIQVHNYQINPFLSWQYFGTTSGVMLRYPDMMVNIMMDELSKKSGIHHQFREICASLYTYCLGIRRPYSVPIWGQASPVIKGAFELSFIVGQYTVSVYWPTMNASSKALPKIITVKWPPTGSSSPRNIDEFRFTSWFSNAITSLKDVVVVLDTSPTLSPKLRKLSRMIAKAVVESIGPNEFVNVMSLDPQHEYIVPCFSGKLVQGTDKNKRKLIQAIKYAKSQNEGNFSRVLSSSCKLLKMYNATKDKGAQCGQALILITDTVEPGFQPIIEDINKPHKPIRVFAFPVSKSRANDQELKNVACSNRGYFAHIEREEEIHEQLLNYLLVMARPWVMYVNDHPISWTPAYPAGKDVGLGYDDARQGRVAVTVSAAVFDKRLYAERTANMLGVAAAEIPVREFQKIVAAHKIGVNGYSFMIDNNGHLVYHPDMRTQYSTSLKQNYLCIDLTEVEHVDYDENNGNDTLLIEMRREMIDQREGEMDITMRRSLDSTKRSISRSYRYFYHPLYETPYTVAIVIPMDYGMYEIKGAEIEIKREDLINITELFAGDNWKVHPDWVYCEYYYPGFKDFSSPETQYLHFLKRATQPGWKWRSMRPRPLDQNLYLTKTDDLPTREPSSYFCDKELFQSVIYDAFVTKDFETILPSTKTLSDDQQQYLVASAAISKLRHQGIHQLEEITTFVATRSGFLRWFDHDPNFRLTEPHFSEMNRRSIDEIWYKRAVDYHHIDPQSYVYTVPFNAGHSFNPIVTATRAFFFKHETREAPAGVVGIQYPYRALAAHFNNITSSCIGHCKKTCSSEALDCYVLDHNGFVIISESMIEAGQFFGDIDGTIMDSLIQDGVYKKVIVSDYQAICEDKTNSVMDAASINTPFETIFVLMRWIVVQFFWFLTKFGELHAMVPEWIEEKIIDENDNEPDEPSYSADDYDGYVQDEPMDEVDNLDYLTDEAAAPSTRPTNTDPMSTTQTTTKDGISTAEEGLKQFDPTAPPLYVPSPTIIRKQHALRYMKTKTCPKNTTLYIMQPKRLNQTGLAMPLKGKLTNCHSSGCERPFSVQKIPYTNLLLLVVDTVCPCGKKQLKITSQNIPGYADEDCFIDHDTSYRRRTSRCIIYHPEEITIKKCSAGTIISATNLIIFGAVFGIFLY